MANPLLRLGWKLLQERVFRISECDKSDECYWLIYRKHWEYTSSDKCGENHAEMEKRGQASLSDIIKFSNKTMNFHRDSRSWKTEPVLIRATGEKNSNIFTSCIDAFLSFFQIFWPKNVAFFLLLRKLFHFLCVICENENWLEDFLFSITCRIKQSWLLGKSSEISISEKYRLDLTHVCRKKY